GRSLPKFQDCPKSQILLSLTCPPYLFGALLFTGTPMTPILAPPEQELVLIFDFGSQYGQLIARRVREQHVFCQIVRHDLPARRVADLKARGLIFSGGPASVYEKGAPHCDPAIFDLNVPVLGICYGMQLACQALGGQVRPGTSKEF